MTFVPPPSEAPRRLQALVRGAGPTGALAALALADAGWAVTLVDPAGPHQIQERSRAYAFTHSTRCILERLGLWQALLPILEPFDRLELEDLGSRQACRFDARDLGPTLGSTQPVGWIAEHRRLMEVLLHQLEAHSAVTLCLGTPSTEAGERALTPAEVQPRPDWILAADGAHSPTRRDLGVRTWRHRYRQSCLTAQVRLREATSRTAWERLRPEGPFALLPMGDDRFQVVWSAPEWRCRQLEDLDPAAFLDALAPVLPPGIDVESIEDTPRVFPVGVMLARRLHRDRTVLLGETAHHCHPVGGQGLNLCWRDVAAVHHLALRTRAGKLPVARLGSCYARRRWLDVGLTLVITDGLVRLFSNRHALLLPLRRLAVERLQRTPPLRRWLLGVMTHGPCQPLQGAPP